MGFDFGSKPFDLVSLGRFSITGLLEVIITSRQGFDE